MTVSSHVGMITGHFNDRCLLGSSVAVDVSRLPSNQLQTVNSACTSSQQQEGRQHVTLHPYMHGKCIGVTMPEAHTMSYSVLGDGLHHDTCKCYNASVIHTEAFLTSQSLLHPLS